MSNKNEQIMIPNFFTLLMEYNIPIEIKTDSKMNTFWRVEGFQKSGHADLYINGNYMECHTRYDTIDIIRNLEDLVKVNALWGAVTYDRNREFKKDDIVKTSEELDNMSIIEILNYSKDTMDSNWFDLFNKEGENLKEYSSQEDSCLTFPQDILDPVINENIPVFLIEREDGRWGYKIDNFYKSGHIDLFLEEGEFYAYDRYNKKEIINDLSDLIYLNIRWAEITQEKNRSMYNDFSEVMTDNWKDLAVHNGIMEAIEVKKTVYKLK